MTEYTSLYDVHSIHSVSKGSLSWSSTRKLEPVHNRLRSSSLIRRSVESGCGLQLLETLATHTNSLNSAVHLYLYRVKIRQETARTTLNGMADRVAYHWTLATNSAYSAHFDG